MPINTDIFSSEYIDADNFYVERNKNLHNHKNSETYYRDVWAFGNRDVWDFGDRGAFFYMHNIDSWNSINMSEVPEVYVNPVEYFEERAFLEVSQIFGDKKINTYTVPDPCLFSMLGFGLLAIRFKKRMTV
jgi:hypothetical protein